MPEPRAEGDIVRVRVFLDVDGVLNAVTHTPGDHWTDWQEATCMGFTIRYSPTCGSLLLELAERLGVDFRWLTTWEHDANKWIAPLLGWPEFSVVERHDIVQRKFSGNITESRTGWWKLDEAQDLYAADPIPFVWIDDDLGFNDDGASDWIQSLGGAGLGIRPASEKGLTPRLLYEIEQFIDGWCETEKDDGVTQSAVHGASSSNQPVHIGPKSSH